MAPPLDFNATLAEQLRDAGMQMRAMTKPQKQNHKDNTEQKNQAAEWARQQDAPETTARPNGNTSDNANSNESTTAGETVRVTPSETVAVAETAVPIATTTPTAPGAPATPAETDDTESTVTMTGSVTAAAIDTVTSTRTDTATDGMADSSPATPSNTPTVQERMDEAAHKATQEATAPATQTAAKQGAFSPAFSLEHSRKLSDASHTSHPSRASHEYSEHGSNADSHGLSSADSHDANNANCHTASHSNCHDTGNKSHAAKNNNAGKEHDNCHSASADDSHDDRSPCPELPDAASELWAMSHHSAAPTLSERSWTGGVRGAVLDALRGLSGGQGHVLVNLKRLATHTGISYGSVRNAMSRLTRSGDIHTRQIRMADGHGVRVDFLTLPGQEGTRQVHGTNTSALSSITMSPSMSTHPAANSGNAQRAAAIMHGQGQSQGQSQGQTLGQSQGQSQGQSHGQTLGQSLSQSQEQSRGYSAEQDMTQFITGQHPVTHAAMLTDMYAYAQPAAVSVTQSAQRTSGQTAGQTVEPTTGMTSGMTTGIPHSIAAFMPVDASSQTPVIQSLPSFWHTDDGLFGCAWPHVAAAGLGMTSLRGLAPIFAIQGFDAGSLPRFLRYLDWELENLGLRPDVASDVQGAESVDAENTRIAEEARQLAQSFVRAMQRRGSWPRPALYEEGDD